MLKGDFIGFTFDGIHSSELGIVRVSDGSRFNENLLPTIVDKTIQVPGGDGSYFFGSYYSQKPFTISIAYDNLTEERLKKIKTLFGDKKIHSLVFDESPYKVYKVKTTGTPSLKYICFNELETRENVDLYTPGQLITSGRVYKGEGTLNFVAYTPFAKCKKKYASDYNQENKAEWLGASGLRNQSEAEGIIDTFSVENMRSTVRTYNPGDLDTDFLLYYIFNNDLSSDGNLNLKIIFDNIEKMNLKKIKFKSSDDGFRINSKLRIIEGVKKEGDIFKPTGTLYNQHISSGDFFKITKIDPKIDDPIDLTIVAENQNGPININDKLKIEYDYLYY